MIGFELQCLCHQRDNVRLRNGLIVADAKRVVGVGHPPRPLRDEPVPRHVAHGFEHDRVADVACGDVPLDHAIALRPSFIAPRFGPRLAGGPRGRLRGGCQDRLRPDGLFLRARGDHKKRDQQPASNP